MVATIQLGGFTFGPGTDTYVPQYGFSQNFNKKGGETGPSYMVNTVTLNGSFRKRTHVENIQAYNSLMSSIRKHEQTLLISDGPTLFNKTVYIDSHNLPLAWNTGIADFEIVCSFIEKDVTVTGYTCSFNGFAFTPMPSISQSYEYDRHEDRNDVDMLVMNLIISGFFKEADFDANLAKILAARDALNVKSGTFIYNKGGAGINATAYVDGFSLPDQFVNEVANYTASFNIYIPRSGLPANVIEEKVKITDNAAFQRHVGVYIPGLGGRTVINLGLSEARYSIGGVVETDSFANTITRINNILTANIPANSVQEGRPQITYEPGSARVTFRYNYSYNN